MKLNIKNEHNQTFNKENNLQLGIEVKLVPMLNEKNTGILTEDLYVLYNNQIYLKDYYTDETTYYVLGLKDTDEYNRDFELHQFEIVDNKENNLNNKGEDNMSKEVIYFAKVKEGAKIPSKRVEDAGFDIYACFDEEEIVIQPHETKMIPTGIASCCSDDYVFILKERGSNGSKGIAQRCGVIDSGYRNEWFVPLTNTTNKLVIITKNIDKYNDDNIIVYPYEKGISQALLVPVPKVEVNEISYEQLKQFKSKRGMGALGSSGK